MAFDEEVPQLHMGPFHWALALLLLGLLGAAIHQQLGSFGLKARKQTCLTRQKTIQDCVAIWENTHGSLNGVNGYAAFTRKTGTIFKAEGLPAAFTGKAISGCSAVTSWCCPEELFRDFHENPALVPDDHGREGYGSYCFVQDDKADVLPLLKNFVASPPPLRMAICTAYGGRYQLGPDGKATSRHSDHW